jgi:ribonuclease HI
MYFDGSLTLEGVGVGVLLISPSSDKLRYALQLHFWDTNNVVEYEALLHGIQVTIKLGAWRLFV